MADLFVDIDYFHDDVSGYEYVQNGNVKVYYPGEGLIPSGIDIPPSEDGGGRPGKLMRSFAECCDTGTCRRGQAFPKYEDFLGVSGPPRPCFI